MMRTDKIRRGLAQGGLGVIALLAASITGCAAASVLLGAVGLFAGLGGLGLGLMIGMATLPFWVGGLFLVGGPVWAVLHWARRRDRLTAVVVGGGVAAVATPFTLWAFATGLSFTVDPNAVGIVLLSALPAAVGGAAAGFTAWRLAYDDGQVR
jgi:hypothetical protein